MVRAGWTLRVPAIAGAVLLASSAGTPIASSSMAAAGIPTAASGASRDMIPPAKTGRRLGFVVTYFWYAMYQGKDACPTGLQHVPTTQEFLATKSPAERDRLLLPANQGELYRLYDARGPKGENLCEAPWAVKDAAMTTLSGDINEGLNLDGWDDRGAPPRNICRQKQYVDEDGHRGIDNQLGRVYACINGIRGKGTLVPYFTTAMRGGMWSMLIDVSGVQDARNDPDVVVDIYAGAEPMARDAAGNPLSNASLSPLTDPKFHRRFKAKITDGVLETATIDDLVIPDIMAKRRPPIRIIQPRLQLTLGADGRAKGLLGGYRTLSSLFVPGEGSGQGQLYVGYQCEGMYHALHRYADGGRDPRTGDCETISAAYKIEAIPAFIVHPDQQRPPSFADAR